MSGPDWPLDPGEQVLWRGRPQGDVHFGGIEMIGIGIFCAVLLAASAGVGQILASAGQDFWPAMAVGGGLAALILAGWPLADAWERRRSHYALTNRRALVRRGGMNRAVESWPIPGPEHLKLVAGPPDSVIFGTRRAAGAGRRNSAGTDAGFFRIADGREVYALMLALARGERP